MIWFVFFKLNCLGKVTGSNYDEALKAAKEKFLKYPSNELTLIGEG